MIVFGVEIYQYYIVFEHNLAVLNKQSILPLHISFHIFFVPVNAPRAVLIFPTALEGSAGPHRVGGGCL